DWSFVNEYANGTLWRVGVFDNFYGNLVIAVDLDSFDARMDRLKSRYYFVAPLALVLAFSGAWFVAKRSLRPVEKLTLAVEGLSAERLDERIEEVGHEKEFQRLLGMFNEMVARLGKSFHQARRFSADASHELKTPLARLQMELEVALKEADLGSKEQVTYSNLLDEMARLGGVVDKLTLLSSSDAGKLEVSLSDVNLSEVLENVVEDCEAMSEGRCFELSIEPGVSVQADRVLLEQALQNVCSNALKHGSRNGVVKISLRQNLGRKIVEIANEGKAIPEAEWEQVFERFYQRDFSRSEQAGGVGLGLSLSREITRAHGGDLKLIRSDGDWTVFEFVL
ncbi:MAG: two-component sensor histidine kinase, partial [Opitutales bacterium]|nr:two-component sensor histidine kinase [Opitutales bacterium]